MKILLILLLFALTGCNTVRSFFGISSFKVGDCFSTDSQAKELEENWKPQRSIFVSKVLEVGNSHYRTMVDDSIGFLFPSSDDFSSDCVRTKVKCTKKLEEYK